MTQLSSSNAGADELWGSRMRVARATLHEAVADKLRHMIVEGVLTPGTRLNERTLCDALGTSRTPLREAMRVLATEGLVEIEPNRGASVAVMSEAEIDEAFELLGGLEALSGELACMRITEEELAELRREHDEMLACHRNEDLPAYYEHNHRIHEIINGAARNNLLTQVYLTVNRRLQALRFRSNLDKSKWDRAVQDHENMVQALAARDGARLAAILRRHIRDKRDSVKAATASRA